MNPNNPVVQERILEKGLAEKYKSGMSMRDLARLYSVSPRTVQKALRRAGVPARYRNSRQPKQSVERLMRLVEHYRSKGVCTR